MNAVVETEIRPLARILNVTEEQYRADPCATPSLNQSIAHVLNTQSPLHAYAQHPKLGNAPREATTPMIQGTVIHALLLGKGSSEIEIITGFDDYRTKAAQIMRDNATARGKTPVLECKHAELQFAAEAIRKNLADQGMVFDGGVAEVAIEWYEEGPEGPVLCRGRLDYLIVTDRWAVIFDPKKIVSADPTTCSRHAKDYGLAIQRAAYVSAVEKLYPHLAGRVEFKFGFYEIDAPYAVAVREPTGEFRAIGEMRWHQAVALWQHCLLSNEWPGYPVEPLEPTPFEMNELEVTTGKW